MPGGRYFRKLHVTENCSRWSVCWDALLLAPFHFLSVLVDSSPLPFIFPCTPSMIRNPVQNSAKALS
jgi:hypothetical protein